MKRVHTQPFTMIVSHMYTSPLHKQIHKSTTQTNPQIHYTNKNVVKFLHFLKYRIPITKCPYFVTETVQIF